MKNSLRGIFEHYYFYCGQLVSYRLPFPFTKFQKKGLIQRMKKIKSYTSIWSVEKVIYAINDFQLPFPLTFSQMAWFVVSLFVVILFGELPPFNMIDGAFLKYFGIPAAFTWFVSQKTFDGKKPFGFLKSCISFFLRPKVTYAGKAIRLRNEKFNTSVTAVRSVMYVPD